MFPNPIADPTAAKINPERLDQFSLGSATNYSLKTTEITRQYEKLKMLIEEQGKPMIKFTLLTMK